MLWDFEDAAKTLAIRSDVGFRPFVTVEFEVLGFKDV
jgi:hypothetical protein